MLEKVSLIIPTKNRHIYLTRILEYYQNSELDIIVADASETPYNKSIPSNCSYYHYPNIAYCEKLKDVFKKVQSCYSLLCADDDFITLNAISQCVSFLDKNPTYSSVQGNYIFYKYSRKKIFYTPAYVMTIGVDIKDDLPTQRIDRYTKLPIQLYYSLHRTDTFRYIFNNANESIKNLNLVELLIGYCSLIKGKHMVLPIFYSVRELLYGSAGKSDRIDTISTTQKYKQEFHSFVIIVSKLLKQNERNDSMDYSHVIQSSIKKLTKHRLQKSPSKSEKLGRIAKKIFPFNIRKVLHHYTLLLTKNKRAFSNNKFALQNKGFPLKESEENKEIKRIESLILRHNIIQ